MQDEKLLAKLANVPLAKPGFNALGLAAPVLCQSNPQGKWESKKPDKLDEERLKAVVQYLTKSQAISSAGTYCCQCAQENKNAGIESNYVPVIMMPIYPADQCPFDMDCEVQRMKALESRPKKATKKADEKAGSDDKDKASKPKKRAFVMQRLTNFDLLSQW